MKRSRRVLLTRVHAGSCGRPSSHAIWCTAASRCETSTGGDALNHRSGSARDLNRNAQQRCRTSRTEAIKDTPRRHFNQRRHPAGRSSRLLWTSSGYITPRRCTCGGGSALRRSDRDVPKDLAEYGLHVDGKQPILDPDERSMLRALGYAE